MRRTNATQPINIASSSIHSSASSEDDDNHDDEIHQINHRTNRMHIHNNNDFLLDNDIDFQNSSRNNTLRSKMNDLNFVGSLPSSRRLERQRMMVGTTGGKDLIYGMGGINNNNNNTMDDNSISHRRLHTASEISMARSMPIPRAPFLSSRRDRESGDKLSRIPNMHLPETADNFESSSVPYGSLRESKFLQRNNNYTPQNSLIQNSLQHNPIFQSNNNNNSNNNPFYRDSDTLIPPKALPELKPMPTKQNHTEGHGGIASLFSNHDSSSVSNNNNTKNNHVIKSSGIGSAIEHMDNNKGCYDEIYINNQQQYSKAPSPNSDKYEYNHTGTTRLDDNYQQECYPQQQQQLSSSLTGLDILEFARKSPGGLGITLTKGEKEEALLRVRSMSDDGSTFLPPPASLPFHSVGQGMVIPPRNISSTSSWGQQDIRRPSSPLQNPDTFEAFHLDMDE